MTGDIIRGRTKTRQRPSGAGKLLLSFVRRLITPGSDRMGRNGPWLANIC